MIAAGNDSQSVTFQGCALTWGLLWGEGAASHTRLRKTDHMPSSCTTEGKGGLAPREEVLLEGNLDGSEVTESSCQGHGTESVTLPP